MFHSPLQQDSQEFLRCLLMQLHDETAVEIPSWSGGGAIPRDTPPAGRNPRRDSMASSTSHESEFGGQSSPVGGLTVESSSKSGCKSSPLPRKKGLARLSLKQKSGGSSQSLVQSSPTNHRRFALRGSSSLGKGRGGSRESEEGGVSGRGQSGGSQVSLESQSSEEDGGRVEVGVYEVDLVTRRVTLHRDCHLFDLPRPPTGRKGAEPVGEGQVRSAGRAVGRMEHQPPPLSARQRRIPGQTIL